MIQCKDESLIGFGTDTDLNLRLLPKVTFENGKKLTNQLKHTGWVTNFVKNLKKNLRKFNQIIKLISII